MKAIIFAAGLGTRLQPWTNTKPKALVEYKNAPLLQHVILKLKSEGFDEIIINIHHFADQVVDFVRKNDSFGAKINFSDETGLLLDTGGGLKKTADFFKNCESFLAYNVDILTDLNLQDFYNYHIENKAIATLAVQKRQTSRQLIFDKNGYLCKWKNVVTGEEKPAREISGTPLPYAFSGIHIISPKIFNKITETGVFSIIDVYLRLAKTEKIAFFDHTKSSWQDMGRKENFDY